MAYIFKRFLSSLDCPPTHCAPQTPPELRLVAEASPFSCGGPCPEPFLAYTTAARSLPCQFPLLLLSKEGFHAILSTRRPLLPVLPHPGAVPASRRPPSGHRL